MRSVKNRQALRLLFEVAPVRIRLCHVPMENDPVLLSVYEERKVGRERPVVSRRNENRKGIRTHESDRVSAVALAKVFGDVHRFVFRPFGAASKPQTIPTAYAPSAASGQVVGCIL